jgi:hypothetical protein
MCQGPKPTRTLVRRVLLHSLDDVFRPLEANDNPHRKEPASEKKLAQGDGFWETRKLVLGWILDTVAMTIKLPEHRRTRLQTILDSIPRSQKRLSVLKWQQVLGELRSMAIAIPGSRGLFSLMQETLKHRPQNRIRLSKGVHDCLDDFRYLDNDLTSRPTRLHEIVAQDIPDVLGASDACGHGIGGVAFPQQGVHTRNDGAPCSGMQRGPSRGTPAPLVWRSTIPPDITRRLVSFNNPNGTITNSDLELLATVVHKDVVAHALDVRERTIATGTDNTPALAWQTTGSVSTTGPAAYLLRIQALHQRFHRYNEEHFYIPGPINAMADDASRLTHLSDAQLLHHFNSHYPQSQPWHLQTPRHKMISSVTCALHNLRADTASYLVEPWPTTARGRYGAASVLSWPSTQPSDKTSRTPSTFSKSSPTDTATAPSPPAVDRSSLERWRVPSVRWARRWPAWGPRTRA